MREWEREGERRRKSNNKQYNDSCYNKYYYEKDRNYKVSFLLLRLRSVVSYLPNLIPMVILKHSNFLSPFFFGCGRE